MIDKLKNIFSNKEKRIENMVSFLIILIITLIVINKILNNNENALNENIDYKNEIGIELANPKEEMISTDLEKRLEDILSKISGVGDVSVLLTYKESGSLVPIYNINSSISTIEEKDTSGGSRVTETESLQKDVVTDSGAEVVVDKNVMPVVEGAIITAVGASDTLVKSNIISAVEAVTGIAPHKIQVFEMEKIYN